MNEIELKIYIELLKRNDEMFISPDGKIAYVLIEGGLIRFTGPNFNEMSADEVNQFIINKLKEANNS